MFVTFRATLEEVVEADILLDVVDVTRENAIEQSQTVQDELAELGAGDKPRATARWRYHFFTRPPSTYAYARYDKLHMSTALSSV